jgi:hypothetical protein
MIQIAGTLPTIVLYNNQCQGRRVGRICFMKWKLAPYLGWKAIECHTGSIWLHVVPELGGRIVNYQLGAHHFLWINPLLAGSNPPPTRLNSNGGWLNWGGDKLWLAPQGWHDDTKWPGPPDPVIDGGPYSVEAIKERDGGGIRLTSGTGAASGMQLSRVLRLEEGTSHLRVTATMTNISDRTRRWGIWSVTQVDACSRSRQDWNRNLRAYVPAHPKSAYLKGYRVLYGADDNPQFSGDGELVSMHYQRIVGKIGIDSPGSWIAVVDGESGKVLVQSMPYEKDREYPDGATVEIWTNGLGMLSAYGRTAQMPESVEENPYLIESELLGPLTTLAPGESASLAYDWYAATIGVDLNHVHRVIDCSNVGCVVRPLSVSADGVMSGHFGCFCDGYAALEFFGEDGQRIGPPREVGSVSMLSPLYLSGTLAAPDNALDVTLAIYKALANCDPSIGTQRLGELGTLRLRP